jgi:hypothetical protein
MIPTSKERITNWLTQQRTLTGRVSEITLIETSKTIGNAPIEQVLKEPTRFFLKLKYIEQV